MRKGKTTFDRFVHKFKALIKGGLVFFCIDVIVVVIKEMQKYNIDEEVIFIVKFCDGNYYICNTFDQTLRKNKIPCQAVANKLRKSTKNISWYK